MLLCLCCWIPLQWGRSPGKKGSHFDPKSDLFLPNERKDIITSTACWTAMAALVVCLSFVMGPVQVLKLYGVPYSVCSISFYFDVLLPKCFPSLIVRCAYISFHSNADLCHVVGLGDLLASPWPWRQASMVPWKGIFIFFMSGIQNLILHKKNNNKIKYNNSKKKKQT